ncbi:MAG: glycerophosphodiester phosphodiesterase [Clostridium sp.]|nr:glycerophosphodiester phosphodiesterase [Clostridium sp.]
MLNFAHRGFSANWPENTKLAFEKAIETPGCDGIEVDVHQTMDGVPVIIHDVSLDRTCVNMKGFVRDYTLEKLEKADMSGSFAGKCEPQKLMTLREYLEMIEPTLLLTNIEIKTDEFEYPGIEENVIALIKEFGLTDRVIISSFNHYTLKRVKELCPEMKCGALTSSRFIGSAGYLEDNGFDALHPLCRSVTPEIAKELISAGKEICAWGITDAESIRQMFKAGVTSVIGDDPELTARIREDMEDEEAWPLGWSVCGYDE